MSAAVAARALLRDCTLRGHTKRLRVAGAQTTAVAGEAVARFAVSNPRVSELLAKTLTAAALLASFLRDEERVILQLLDERGAVRRLYAEAMACGEVRGFCAGPGVSETDSAAFGDGLLSRFATLTVTRVLYDGATPVSSTVAIDKGDVESDLQRYFYESEQVESATRLEASTMRDGSIGYAGGVIVQALAGEGGRALASPDRPTALADVLARLGDGSFSLASCHARATPLAAAVALLVPELDGAAVVSAAPGAADVGAAGRAQQPLLLRTPLDFYCRCSKARFVEKLRGAPELARQVLQQQAREGAAAPPSAATAATLVCQFCNSHYDVTTADVWGGGAEGAPRAPAAI